MRKNSNHDVDQNNYVALRDYKPAKAITTRDAVSKEVYAAIMFREVTELLLEQGKSVAELIP